MSLSKRKSKQTNKTKQKVKYRALKVMEKYKNTSLTAVHIKTEKDKTKLI